MYILVQKSNLDWTSFADWFILVNIIKSLSFFSFNLLNYGRMLRLGREESQLLELFSFASLFHFAWRLSMVASRILALVLFASLNQAWVFAVVCVHLFFSYLLLRGQPNNYFEEGSVYGKILRFAFAFVNVFCFFPLAGKDTRKWGGPYYMVTFIENSILVLMWYFYSDRKHSYKVMMLIAEWGLFLFGLLSLIVYYRVFHPSLKKPRRCWFLLHYSLSSNRITTLPPHTQQHESNVWILFDTEVSGILYHFLSSNQLSTYILMNSQEQN